MEEKIKKSGILERKKFAKITAKTTTKMETTVLTNLTVYDTNFFVINRAVFETELYWDLKGVLTVVACFILMALVCSVIFLVIALAIFYKVSHVLITKGEPNHRIFFRKTMQNMYNNLH